MARFLPGLRMTKKGKKVEKLLLRLLRAWYGMAPMTSTGVYLCGCIMFFCVFSQGATSSPPAVSAADSSAVRELAHSLKARVGMAAEMLDTGETVMVGDEAAYPMQSVVKFVLALSVLKRVDQGAMNLEQIIRIRPEQLVKDTWSPLR